MSKASERQNPPPIAAPLTAAMTGCGRAHGRDDIFQQLHRAQPDAREGEAVDTRWIAGVHQIGAGTEAAPFPGQYDDAHVVVGANALQRLPQGNHHVERHGVHPLGPVERDQADVRAGLLDPDEAHTKLERPSVPNQEAVVFVPSGRGAISSYKRL